MPTGQVPVGTVISYAGVDPEQWESNYWLLCDGKPYDSTSNAYSNLFKAIGNQYGSSGDMFNVPDLRGMFLRGVGVGTLNDPDIADRYRQGDTTKTPIPVTDELVGSVQDDQFGSHAHSLGSENGYKSGGEYPVYLQGTQSANATGSSGGDETRPKNVYVYFLIFAGPPVGETRS